PRKGCSSWGRSIELATLKEFEDMVRKDFAGPGPYPTYNLPLTTKTTPPSTTIPFPPAATSETPTPSYGQRYPSPPKPAYPAPPVSQSAYMTPPTTPSPSYYSASTSPASPASPPTPPGIEDLSAKIVSASSSPTPPAKLFRPALFSFDSSAWQPYMVQSLPTILHHFAPPTICSIHHLCPSIQRSVPPTKPPGIEDYRPRSPSLLQPPAKHPLHLMVGVIRLRQSQPICRHALRMTIAAATIDVKMMVNFNKVAVLKRSI
ncbi:hypothetical protein BJ138DRAFT_1201254, partial [Hygrophoropsis aurantiaca]